MDQKEDLFHYLICTKKKEGLKAICPAANGVGNAKSLAKILAVIANYGEINGVRLLKKETVQKMVKFSTPVMVDAALGIKTQFTDGGFGSIPELGFDKCFMGWGGLGGSLAQFCPEKNAVFVYTMTGMLPIILGDERIVTYVLPALPELYPRLNS